MRHKRDVSAGVIVFHEAEEGRRYLLLLSRLTKRPLWEFPKGGVDPGETVREAALRELQEESGLAGPDIRIVPDFEASERYRFTVGHGERRTVIHKEVHYLLARAMRTDVRLSAKETLESAWVDLETAIKRLRYAGRRQILREADVAADSFLARASGPGA